MLKYQSRAIAPRVGFAALVLAGLAGAQTAPDADAKKSEQLGEIVVTATRHEESLSKVPISVSAFSQEAMDTKGVKDFADLVKYTPGVTIDSNQTNSISIRGISSSGGAGTTGIYVDDTPIQIRALGFNPDDALPKTFDLDRVEVLRGPQGTLFGAGSEGGTVRYILPQPSLTKSSTYGKAEVSFTQGGSANYEAGIAQGGPIIQDVLGFRASAWYRRDGGWIDQVDSVTHTLLDKNANHDETVLLRLAAAWQPVDGVLVTPSMIYQDRKRNNISDYWPILSNPSKDEYVSGDPNATREPDTYYLPMLKIEAKLGGMKFISNSSYFHRKDYSGYEGTLYNLSYYQTVGWPASYPVYPFLNQADYPLIDSTGIHLPAALAGYHAPARVTNQQDNYTQEFRLQSDDDTSRWNWTVGVFAQVNKERSIEELNDPMANQLFETLFGQTIDAFGGALSADGNPVPLLANGDVYVNDQTSFDRQIAGFGEVNFAITDTLKVIAGARYSKTQYSFAQIANGPQNGGLTGGTGVQKEKPFTPKLGLSYQMDPGNLFYATYAKGFRIGGESAPIPQGSLALCGLSAEPPPYTSDTTQSFEVGAKNKLFDSLRLASSVYYIKWNKIQQNVYIPNCGFQYTANLGTAVAKGFDLQADLAVTDAVTLESAIGFTSARYTRSISNGDPLLPQNIVNSGDAILGESNFPAAPWTATLGAEYKFNVADHESFARIDYEWQSHNHWYTAFTDPNQTTQYSPYAYNQSPTTFVSFRAGSSFSEDWKLQVFIDNLLDSHTSTNYQQTQLDGFNPNGSPAPLERDFTFRPRTFGLTLLYRH